MSDSAAGGSSSWILAWGSFVFAMVSAIAALMAWSISDADWDEKVHFAEGDYQIFINDEWDVSLVSSSEAIVPESIEVAPRFRLQPGANTGFDSVIGSSYFYGPETYQITSEANGLRSIWVYNVFSDVCGKSENVSRCKNPGSEAMRIIMVFPGGDSVTRWLPAPLMAPGLQVRR